MHPVLRPFFQNKWLTLVVGCIIMLSSGTQYMFGVYAPTLKVLLGYTQAEINLVGTSANIGAYFGIIAGFVYDRFGGRVAALVGCAIIFSGYFLIWATASGWFSVPCYVVCMFAFMFGNGTSFTYNGALGVNLKNFDPRYRGIVIGISVAFFGVSSAFFTQIYSFVFQPQVLDFLLVLAIATPAIILLCIPFLSDLSHLNKPMIQPVEVSINTGGDDGEPTNVDIIVDEKVVNSTERSALLAGKATYKTISDDDDIQNFQMPEYNPMQVLLSLDFWLLIICFFAAVGCAVTIINNIGSLVLSLGAMEGSQLSLVTIISVCNCAGRVIFGVLSDKLYLYFSRPKFFVASLLVLIISQLFLSFANLDMVYFCAAITGLSVGSFFSVTPAFINENFGQRHLGVNLSLINIGSASASMILSTLVAGRLYQEQIHSRRLSIHYFTEEELPISHTMNHNACFGVYCYRYTFWITAGCAFVGLLAALLLVYRTRGFYDKLTRFKYVASLRQREEAAAQK